MEDYDSYTYASFQYHTKEVELLMHYDGDPLFICQSCTKFGACKEECLDPESKVEVPRHFKKVIEINNSYQYEKERELLSTYLQKTRRES